VGELTARMSARELDDWLMYYEIEPFGPHVSDVRAATISTLLANANRGEKTRAFKLKDFMLGKQITPVRNDLGREFDSLALFIKENAS